MGETTYLYKIEIGYSDVAKRLLGRLQVDGTVILKRRLRKQNWRIRFIWHTTGTGGGF
jgi:hypothetical protein